MKRLKRFLITSLLILSMSITAPVTSLETQYSQTAAVVQAKAKYVYITPTGKCYHTHKCGRGTYYKAKLKTAKKMGLRKCKKCY